MATTRSHAQPTRPQHFRCPRCARKHRADLGVLATRRGAIMHVACKGCGVPLAVRLEDGIPVCQVVEAHAPSAPSAEPAMEPGSHAGRYEIRALLARSLSSLVYRAFDPTTNREVALKVLRRDAPEVQERRFLRQVEVQATIRHPHILPIFDRGRTDDGRPFFATVLLEGPRTFGEVAESLHRDRPAGSAPPPEALRPVLNDVFLPVAEGIYVANIENGVAHANLRPENVVVDSGGRPYVIDFGRSRAIARKGRGAEALAEVGEASLLPRARPPWLAPEQARGDVHARTDVWGLGALLHLLLAGRPPLGEDAEPAGPEVREGRYVALPADAPLPLVAVVRKAMATEPEARYVNARQLAADVQAWLRGSVVRAIEERGGRQAAMEGVRRALRQNLAGLIVAAVALAVGLALGSRVEVGVAAQGGARVTAAERELEVIVEDTDRLEGFATSLSAEAGWRMWRDLEARVARADARLAAAPPTQGRDAVRDRLAFARRRFAPPRVLVQAPEGARVRARHVASNETFDLDAGMHALAPGRYEIEGPDGAAWHADLPLRIRNPREDPAAEAPAATWSVP